MDGLVPLTVMVGAVLFCSGKGEIILDGTRDPGLVLDGVEDFIDGELEQSELFTGL